MNRTFLIVMILAVLLGCKDRYSKPQKQSNAVDSTNTKMSTAKVEAVKQEEEIIPMPTNCNEALDDFESFFERFGKDSVFQKSRVKFPLEHSSFEYDYSLDKDTLVKNQILKDQYVYHDFSKDKDAANREYDRYEVFLEKEKDHYVYKLRSIDGDAIFIDYKFGMIDKCWVLVSIYW